MYTQDRRLQKFRRKYYNKKNTTPGITSGDEKPFFLFDIDPPMTGHDLFRKDSRISINEEVTHRREALCLDNKQHAGLFQTVLKARWDELSEENKAQWNNRAALENTANKTQGEGQVFRYVKINLISVRSLNNLHRNQEEFPALIRKLFGQMIGTGSHQVGSAAFHLLYGFRNIENRLTFGS